MLCCRPWKRSFSWLYQGGTSFSLKKYRNKFFLPIGDGGMGFRELDIKSEYRSLIDDIIGEFYIPALEKAVLYKRAVGFFSSTALIEVSKGICGLVKNGGRILLV